MWPGPGPWLPSHRAPVVLGLLSFFVLGVGFFAFAGVGLLCFLGVILIFWVMFHRRLIA